jgi:sulfatase maturation enzyme AslB (radical SAM superfamily)
MLTTLDVQLLVSGECNLACDYCYQNRRRVASRMPVAVAESVLERLSAAGHAPRRVIFAGGEPLLAKDLVWHVASSLRRASENRDPPIELALATNGTLLEDGDLARLEELDLELQVSFDGPEPAQRHRAVAAAPTLERLLERLRVRHPSYFQRRVALATTFHAATLGTLAESVRYLLAQGVAELRVRPVDTHDPGWPTDPRGQLAGQMDAIVEDSLVHWRRTGQIPVGFLRTSRAESRRPEGEPFLCAAPTGHTLAVDPDGRGWACPTFAASLQSLPPLAAEVARVFDLGPVQAPDFIRRLEGLPEAARGLDVLTGRERKASAVGRCVECECRDECFVCPVTVCHVPGNRDPDRIPDIQCTFNALTYAARRQFRERTGPLGTLRELRQSLEGLVSVLPLAVLLVLLVLADEARGLEARGDLALAPVVGGVIVATAHE